MTFKGCLPGFLFGFLLAFLLEILLKVVQEFPVFFPDFVGFLNKFLLRFLLKILLLLVFSNCFSGACNFFLSGILAGCHSEIPQCVLYDISFGVYPKWVSRVSSKVFPYFSHVFFISRIPPESYSYL